MIKLTNSIAPLHGMDLYLNPELILSIFEEPDEPEGSLKTKIFCAAGGMSWTFCVEESPSEVYKKLKRYREGYND